MIDIQVCSRMCLAIQYEKFVRYVKCETYSMNADVSAREVTFIGCQHATLRRMRHNVQAVRRRYTLVRLHKHKIARFQVASTVENATCPRPDILMAYSLHC